MKNSIICIYVIGRQSVGFYVKGCEAVDNIAKRRNFIINVVYIIIIAGLFYLFMKYAFGVLSPFIIAMFIAMLLQRPVNYVIEKTKIPRGIVSTVAVLLVVFVFGTIIGLILSKIFSELKSFFNYIMLQLTMRRCLRRSSRIGSTLTLRCCRTL